MKTSRIARDTDLIIGALNVTSRMKLAHDVAFNGPTQRVTRSVSSTSTSSKARSAPAKREALSKSSSSSSASTIDTTLASGSSVEKGAGAGSESQQEQQQEQEQQPVRRLSARVKAYSYQAQVHGSQHTESIIGSDATSGSGASVSKKRKRQLQPHLKRNYAHAATAATATAAAVAAVKIEPAQSDVDAPTEFPSDAITAAPTNSPPLAHGKSPRKRAKRQPAKRISGADGSVLRVDPPARWEEMYRLTEQMRARILAPVDTMGCESLAEEKRSPRDKRFQTLVALMLSSQTKDTVNAVAMRNLQEGLPGGFNLESMLKVDPPVLNKLIEKVGFHNNKTRFIKSAAEILRAHHNSDIPTTIDGLISLPGVGPKMAYLCMSAAWGRDEGIGVDVHVHRITNLWGWHATKTPEETRAMLEAWLPREKWHKINHLLVGFGQTICLPVGRKCGECDLAKEGLCPSAVSAGKIREMEKRREKRAKEVKRDEVVVEAAEMVKEEGEGGGGGGEIAQLVNVGIKVEEETVLKEKEKEEEEVPKVAKQSGARVRRSSRRSGLVDMEDMA